MHPNQYADGTKKAVLRQDQMKVKKWQPGNAFYGRAIGLLNIAFDNYYSARTGINSVTDADHQKKMLAELDDCACDGFGFFGVDVSTRHSIICTATAVTGVTTPHRVIADCSRRLLVVRVLTFRKQHARTFRLLKSESKN